MASKPRRASLFSFIPIVRALLSGLVAVLMALATQGLTAALLVLLIVILVQQLEGHILQPVIQGKLVAIHPLAVVSTVDPSPPATCPGSQHSGRS